MSTPRSPVRLAALAWLVACDPAGPADVPWDVHAASGEAPAEGPSADTDVPMDGPSGGASPPDAPTAPGVTETTDDCPWDTGEEDTGCIVTEPVMDVPLVVDEAYAVWLPDVPASRMGEELSTPGDLDGDGDEEILVSPGHVVLGSPDLAPGEWQISEVRTTEFDEDVTWRPSEDVDQDGSPDVFGDAASVPAGVYPGSWAKDAEAVPEPVLPLGDPWDLVVANWGVGDLDGSGAVLALAPGGRRGSGAVVEVLDGGWVDPPRLEVNEAESCDGDDFGAHLTRLGDQDGDGVEELLMGVADDGWYCEGSVHAVIVSADTKGYFDLYESTDGMVATFAGAAHGGLRVDRSYALGDVDDDGLDDIGLSDKEGGLFIPSEPPEGSITAFDAAGGSLVGDELQGFTPEAPYRSDVAEAASAMVVVLSDSFDAYDSERVVVMPLIKMGVVTPADAWLEVGTLWGVLDAAAGDFDGDSIDDLAVSLNEAVPYVEGSVGILLGSEW